MTDLVTFDFPAVMGVLNVTPDSFSDGGQFRRVDDALLQAERMIAAGATIIDIGGESTRPGADDVGLQEELDRVLPVIESLRRRVDSTISIDTSKPGVMRAAVAAGADWINDINALRAEGALTAAASAQVPVVLMHMQGVPVTMQQDPQYNDVVEEVTAFLLARVANCVAAGIDPNNVILDPGFGFGKTLAHNIELLARLDEIVALGFHTLVGVSRKSMLGDVTNRAVNERLAAGIAAATLAVASGASIVRTHDVAETVDAVKMAQAVKQQDDD